MTNPAPALSEADRTAILNQHVAKYARDGWQVQSVSGSQAVLSRNKRIGWFWNTVLVLITGGLWLIYVIYKALNRKSSTMIISVDAYGRVAKR